MINPGQQQHSADGIMVRMIGHGKRVLEIGIASDFMSRRLSAAGNHVTGIAFDPDAAGAAEAFCERVLVADVDDRHLGDLLPGASFDVVTLGGDVLGHLRDPLRVLEQIRDVLASDGYAAISIPNVAHGNVRLALLHGRFDAAVLGRFDNGHRRFLTLRSVRDLCLRAGYRVVEVERTKAPLFDESTPALPRVSRDDFAESTVDEIVRDPEHDTLQFIVRAVPVRDGDPLAAALDAIAEAEAVAAESLARVNRLEREWATERAERGEDADRLEAILAERDELRARLDEAAAVDRARGDERATALEELRAEARTLRAELAEAGRAVGEAYALRVAVDHGQEALAALAETARRQAAAHDDEVARLQALASAAESEAAMLRRTLAELRADHDESHIALRARSAEIEAMAASVREADAAVRSREAASLATIAELRQALVAREREIDDLRLTGGAGNAVATHAREERIVVSPGGSPADAAALRRLDEELQRLGAQHRATVEAIAEHLDTDIAIVRAEMAEIDGLIKEIQRSPTWLLKKAIRRLRAALPGGRARV